MTAQPPSPREQIDRLFVLIRRSLSYWKRALVVFFIGTLLVIPYVLTRPREYRSETVILYQETIHSADTTGADTGTEGARRVGARLRELLLSRQSLEPIINDLKLFQDSIVHGELIGAVEEMRKHVTFRAREGDTFEISFIGDDPKQTQEVTRRLGDCIIAEAASRRTEQANTLKQFLNGESTRNETDLKQKEDALSKFVSQHPEFTPRLQGLQQNTPTPGGNSLTPRSSDPYLANLENRAARIDRQLRAASSATPAPPPPPAEKFVPPPDSAELIAARKDLADKLQRYTDKHPDVVAARNRLKAAEEGQAAANDAAADAFAAKHAAQRQEEPVLPPKNATDEAALRKELSDLQNQIGSRRAALAKAAAAGVDAGAPAAIIDPTTLPASAAEVELEFRRLQRDVAESRDRQEKLDERLFRAQITASSVMNDRNIQVSVLDPAFLPVRPTSKPRSVIAMGGLGAVFFVAFIVAAGSAFLDDRVYDRVDVERLDILPVLAVIPRSAPQIRQLEAGGGGNKSSPPMKAAKDDRPPS